MKIDTRLSLDLGSVIWHGTGPDTSSWHDYLAKVGKLGCMHACLPAELCISTLAPPSHVS